MRRVNIFLFSTKNRYQGQNTHQGQVFILPFGHEELVRILFFFKFPSVVWHKSNTVTQLSLQVGQAHLRVSSQKYLHPFHHSAIFFPTQTIGIPHSTNPHSINEDNMVCFSFWVTCLKLSPFHYEKMLWTVLSYTFSFWWAYTFSNFVTDSVNIFLIPLD